MRPVELLGKDSDDHGASGVSQALEFAEMIFEGFPRASPFQRGTDEQGAFSRIINRDQVA